MRPAGRQLAIAGLEDSKYGLNVSLSSEMKVHLLSLKE
jgi:hypothetical protein